MPRYDPARITKRSLCDLPNGVGSGIEVLTGPAKWYLLAESYREAADRLAENVKAEVWGDQLLANPILFLYRHYIELHLKSLLHGAGELLDDPQQIPPKHYLRTLWQRVRSLLLRISPESNGEWFDRAAQIIHEFDALDANSFAFRYPVDTDGKASFPTPFEIDASNIKGIIAELQILLVGASTQIDVYEGYKSEMAAEGY
jgi:hypothetical protein